MARLSIIGLLLVLAALPPAPAVAARPGQTQAQLRELRARIERAAAAVNRDALDSDRLARDLRTAEQAVAGARGELADLGAQVAAHAARRAALAQERERERTALERERQGLGRQLRVAYLMERSEPLQLLLNQRDPAQASRMFAWYGYFGRARAGQIAAIRTRMQNLDALDDALQQQESALAELRGRSARKLAELENGRDRRQGALASLQVEARSRAATLARLRTEQASLERLLRELSRVTRPAAPPDTRTAFGRLRGRLDWPVAGRVSASYGEQRASGVTWDGMVVVTERGAPVRAVSAGTLIYADWLPGLGLLAIVDHGEGYISLYGYNDQLRKSVGDAVAAGEVIAAAGDTGGQAQPQLYFELRHAGRPVDPRPWFQRRSPD